MASPEDQSKAVSIDETTAYTPKFDKNGLMPAVAIEQSSGKALMLAFMNEEAINQSLETGYAHFWSRSRGKLWQKGETSGNRLKLIDVLIDCDQDSLCLMVEIEGHGAACHTGRSSCYYRELRIDDQSEKKISLSFKDDPQRFDPASVYGRKA